ncbi:hypothetical protein KJ632_04280 [Patescibacteria group bacterium]|nr:hypothetical protein [Patescibacteria group bacterium]
MVKVPLVTGSPEKTEAQKKEDWAKEYLAVVAKEHSKIDQALWDIDDESEILPKSPLEQGLFQLQTTINQSINYITVDQLEIFTMIADIIQETNANLIKQPDSIFKKTKEKLNKVIAFTKNADKLLPKTKTKITKILATFIDKLEEGTISPQTDSSL